MSNTNIIGERIKYLRSLADMSQEELGKRVGVQRAAINKYEKGGVTNVPIHMIEKIANVFEVSPSYIVGWNGSEGNPLSAEVKVLQGVKRFYGRDSVDLLETFTTLNTKGRKRLMEYAGELEQISSYHKKEIMVEVEPTNAKEVLIEMKEDVPTKVW